MSAVILRFPPRGRFANVVRIEHELDGEGWLLLTPRGHGWLDGDFPTALRDAREIAAGYGVAVRSSADWTS
jgi:hypothetical protein